MATRTHDPFHGLDVLGNSPDWWEHRWQGFFDSATWGRPYFPAFAELLECEVPDAAFPFEWRTHAMYVFATAAVLIAMRFATEFLVLQSIVEALYPYADARKHKGSKFTRLAWEKTIIRLRQTLWRGLFWTTMTVFGVYVLSSQKWFYFSADMINNYPGHDRPWLFSMYDDFFVKSSCKYFMIQTGHAVSMFITVFVEPRRSDHYEMIAHHILTLICLVGAWMTGFHRIASLIQFVHDISDVFLEWGKFFNYLDHWMQSVMFAFLFFSWIGTRLAWFPLKIMYAAVTMTLAEDRDCTQCSCVKGTIACLLTLALLHWYWFALICKVLVRQLSNKGFSDIREDDVTSDDAGSSSPKPSRRKPKKE